MILVLAYRPSWSKINSRTSVGRSSALQFIRNHQICPNEYTKKKEERKRL